jgi:hypothetical protein
MRCADEALLELSEREPELAAALALRAEQARSQYRQELAALLQAAPDSERPAIEGILDLSDSLHPHPTLGEDDAKDAPDPSSGDADSEAGDGSHPSDDVSPPAVEPRDQDNDETRDGEIAPSDPDGAGDTPIHADLEEGTPSGPESGEQDERDEDEADHDAVLGDPAQDGPGTDEGSGSTSEPGDQGDTDSGSPDDGEHDRTDDEDDSAEHGESSSDDDTGQEDHSDQEHDRESRRDD